jgi:single-stranded-DNA-specific exonuclease
MDWEIQLDRSKINDRSLLHAVLERRGFVESDDQERFLNPKLQHLSDPFRIHGMREAVERLERAIEQKKNILLYCDYDADGITSSSLLYLFIKQLGGNVDVFVPDRFLEGYGLSALAIERMVQIHPSIDLLITLDCGTTNLKEVEALQQRGIEIIIIDHHEIPEQGAPPAQAFVNPHSGHEDHELATVGLVFKFCHALLKMRQNPELFDLKSHLDLVALGTVADLVPLIQDNRIFVRHGLKVMGQTPHIGLQELIKRAGVKNSPTPSTCGFLLGPRLNASGRMANARAGWELLTTQDRTKAFALATELDQFNKQRQEIEQVTYDEALSQIEPFFDPAKDFAIVLASRNWHQGVVGIVASRLQRRFYRPTIIISIDEQGKGKGSCRTIEGCSLIDALRACEKHLIKFGGHVMAAGLEISEEKIDEFRVSINRWVQAHVDVKFFNPKLKIECSLLESDLGTPLAQELSQMEPFGRDNPSPIFAVREVQPYPKSLWTGRRISKFRAKVQKREFDVLSYEWDQSNELPRQMDIAGYWEMDDYTGEPCLRMIDWK